MKNTEISIRGTRVENMIYLFRGKRVMIDYNPAILYGVTTKRLSEQVKRNRKRFPGDFMFQLTFEEKEELAAGCDRLNRLKHSSSMPYAFIQEGISMLSSVLTNEKAIAMNIYIMRVFVKLRSTIFKSKDMAGRVSNLEKEMMKQGITLRHIMEYIDRLYEKKKNQNGK